MIACADRDRSGATFLPGFAVAQDPDAPHRRDIRVSLPPADTHLLSVIQVHLALTADPTEMRVSWKTLGSRCRHHSLHCMSVLCSRGVPMFSSPATCAMTVLYSVFLCLAAAMLGFSIGI